MEGSGTTSVPAASDPAPPRPGMDPDSAAWVSALTGSGAARRDALARLHDLLVRAASAELRRRPSGSGVSGAEADDLVHHAAADAMLAVLGKVRGFRGESRFTTWAYRFVVLEVSSQLGRHYRAHTAIQWEDEDWDRLPDRFDVRPEASAERAELIAAVRRAVDEVLTDHQRRAFVAIVLNGVPVDAAVGVVGPSRNAIYKSVFDARRRIRGHLVATGFLRDAPQQAR